MTLRLKLFLMGLFVALFVGILSAVMFARSWRDLAQTYALSSLDLRIKNFDSVKDEGGAADEWALDLRTENDLAWASKPESVAEDSLVRFSTSVREAIHKTRLKGGTFETRLPVSASAQQTFVVSFKKVPDSDRILVAGISSETSFRRFSAWAAPFLGIIVAGILAAIIAAFLITKHLNAAYTKISSGLRAIGKGQLDGIDVPKSNDPAIQEMSAALAETVAILRSKNTTILEQTTTINKVSTLVNEDPLTGISNRRAFDDFIEGLMSGTFITNSVPVMGIIDLDHFKNVNDTHGHSVGDFVLKETTRIITECIRDDDAGGSRSPDFFARIGGEEFVVIFTSVRVDSVHIGAERILRKIKSTKLRVPAEIAKDGVAFELSVSASIGLALWGKQSFSREEWIKEADEALYDAKKAGRGRIVQLKPTRREWA